MTAADTPELVYAPPLPWRRRRNARRLFLLCLMMLLVGSGSIWFATVRDRALIFYWQHKCLRHAVPASTVVHDYPTLDEVDRSGVRMVPRQWEYLYGTISPPGLRSEGTAFLHEMRTADGKRRLVAVDVVFKPRPHSNVLTLAWRVIQPASPLSSPRLINTGESTVQLPVDFGYFRVLAGRPDSSDSSHFTFECEFASRSQTLDGWLRDDDTVTIEKYRK